MRTRTRDSDASVGDLVDEIKEVLDPLRSKIEKVKEEGPAARAAVVDALREHVITVAASWVADLNTTKKETKQKASTDDRAPAAAL